MHVGMGIIFQGEGEGRTDRNVYQNELRLGSLAEPLGFESLWGVEHHFTDYTMVPDVVQFLSYMAAKTTHAKLGSMVIVLPWHDPVRVAEQVSMLDNLSGGRMILGIGRGLGRVEFEGFRLDMSTARQRFVEYSQMLLEGLENGYVEFDGEFVQQPRRDIRPKPFKSFRGRTFAAAVSPDSMPIMAKLGVGLLVIPQKPWKDVKIDFENYYQFYREANGEDPPPPLCGGFYYVDENADRAEERAMKHIGNYYKSVLKHYEFTAGHLKTTKGYEYYGALTKYIAKRGEDGAAADFASLMPWGTPEQVYDKLMNIHSIIGQAGIMTHFSYSGMPFDEAEKSMRLFAKEVIPELKKIKVDSPAFAETA